MSENTYSDERADVVPGARFSVILRELSISITINVKECELLDDGTLVVTGERVYQSGRRAKTRTYTITPDEGVWYVR